MNHLGTLPLKTSRLTLRPLTLADSQAAFNNWTSDPKVTPYLTWPVHKDLSVTKEVITDWSQNYQKNDFYQWGIVLDELNEPIGTISAVSLNEKTNSVEIGYCIGSRWWHQGITSEALAAVSSFFFEQVKVNRLEAKHDLNNPNSGKVMEKCGLTFEGLDYGVKNNQGLVTVASYSLLKEEYFKEI